MSEYTDAIAAEPIGGIMFRLTEPLTWAIGKADSGMEYTVPAGFIFDVSIPVWLRWAFNPTNRHFLKAAALHDHMLFYGWSRIQAAAVFHDALKASGVSVWRRLTMFIAVALWRYQ